MQLQPTLPLLLTVKDVMRELHVGRSKVEALIKYDGLPVVRLGRAVRISKRSLERWIEARESQQVA
jgi:excisionase family DNA binding protein